MAFRRNYPASAEASLAAIAPDDSAAITAPVTLDQDGARELKTVPITVADAAKAYSCIVGVRAHYKSAGGQGFVDVICNAKRATNGNWAVSAHTPDRSKAEAGLGAVGLSVSATAGGVIIHGTRVNGVLTVVRLARIWVRDLVEDLAP